MSAFWCGPARLAVENRMCVGKIEETSNNNNSIKKFYDPMCIILCIIICACIRINIL